MLHVQTNGAVRAKDGNGNMLLVRTRVAYADECCMLGKLLQVMWRRKGNERAEIRSTTIENHENQEREKRNK